MTLRSGGQFLAGAPGSSRVIFAAIPQTRLREIKTAGVDEAGNQLTVQVDTEGGSPLRCCLLIAYTPPGTGGAYAERGPVFIHADPCDGYLTPSRYPPRLRLARIGSVAQELLEAMVDEGGVHGIGATACEMTPYAGNDA
jgi:uncharacterized protein DUF1203